jgi:hypothetical protein
MPCPLSELLLLLLLLSADTRRHCPGGVSVDPRQAVRGALATHNNQLEITQAAVYTQLRRNPIYSLREALGVSAM